MRGIMEPMLGQALAKGDFNAMWRLTQFSLLSGDQGALKDMIGFVIRYPRFWPDDFRKRIFALDRSMRLGTSRDEAARRLVRRNAWKRKMRLKRYLRRQYEKMVKRGLPVSPRYDLFIDEPEPT